MARWVANVFQSLSYRLGSVNRVQRNWLKPISHRMRSTFGATSKLNASVVLAMWKICSYEVPYRALGITANDTMNEAFCSLFTDEELEVCEWVSDYELWARYSVPSPRNSQSAMYLIQDIAKGLEKALEADDGEDGSGYYKFRISHHQGMVGFATYLVCTVLGGG